MKDPIRELRQQAAQKVNEADALRQATKDKWEALPEEERKTTSPMSEEEERKFDDLMAEVKALRSQAEDLEREEELRLAKQAGQARNVPGPRSLPEENRSVYDLWPTEESDQFLNCARGVYTNVRDDLAETFRQARAGNPEFRAPNGQGTLIDGDGGFLVPTTISSTILQKTHSEGQVVSRAQAVPITVGNTAKWNAVTEDSRASGSRYGGITTARTAEGSAITASTASIQRVSLEVKKLGTLVYVTDEQLEDGAQMRTLIGDLAPRNMTFAIEDEMINGLGGPTMEGVLAAPATVEVAKEVGQAAATVVYENIVSMYSRMHAPSRSNAVWFINQDIEPQLFIMSLAVGTGGTAVYLPAGGASASPFGSLFGRPVIPIEHCQTLGTAGDIILADMSQYLYATKGGVRSATSMHVLFTSEQQAFRFTIRNDGKSWWPAALTPANGTNTQSPFVTVAVRA